MRTIRNLLALLLVAATGAWAYYSNAVSARPAMDMTMRVTSGSTPFPVTLGPVERGPIQGTVVYTGSVAPFNEEDVYPRVTGRIVEMAVYPGDFVRAGQVVARLDDVELTSRVREAEAMAATVRASRAQMEADLAAARHGVTQMEKELAVVEAEAGYQDSVAARDERLVARGAVSQQEAESSRAVATAALARVQAARARVEQAKAVEASARRKLEAADAMAVQGEAQAKTARVVRDYVNIRATTSGYVVKRVVAPGVLVQPGMPILKIAQIDKVRLQANVGERDLPQIQVGSPVTVTVAGNGMPPLAARVTSVFPFVDPGARTAVVEAVVQNNGRHLVPGQYTQMQFVTGEQPDVLSVPRRAVSRMGGRAKVWIVRDDRAEPREVISGLENAERVEITRGLAGDELVIVSGYEGLYAGARVTAVPSRTAAPEGAGQAPERPARPALGGQGGQAPGPAPGAPPTSPGHVESPAKPRKDSHAAH